VLGVAQSADGEIIRAAYRVLAKRYHPDTATGPKDIAAARFHSIQEAYEVLSDTRRRAKYDTQLDAAAREPETPQSPPRPPPEPPRHSSIAQMCCRGVGHALIMIIIVTVIEWIVAFGARQPPPAGMVLRFDKQGNLVQALPATPPAGLVRVELDSRRSEWCVGSAPQTSEWVNLNDPASVQRFEGRRRQAGIKCNNQRREWCADNPLGPWERGRQELIELNGRRREWCAKHPPGT
jgi:hypothetical protein